MRKIRGVLWLRAQGLSKRRIAASLGVSATDAVQCLQRARRAGLSWPLPHDLDDTLLELRLFPPATLNKVQRPQPQWPSIHRELKRPGVTLQLLWEQYRGQHPGGYGYSQFCDLYRAWKGRLTPTMRQTHIAGERAFVDDGRFPRLFRSLTKVDLLVLDDWGPERLSASQRRDLMEIIEERHGRSSTLDYTKAIEINPIFVMAYDNRGATYRAKGEYDRAIAQQGYAHRLCARVCNVKHRVPWRPRQVKTVRGFKSDIHVGKLIPRFETPRQPTVSIHTVPSVGAPPNKSAS